MLVSAIQQCESVITIPSLLSLPFSPPPDPTPLGRHRAPGLTPCDIQQHPTSYFTHGSVCMSMLLSQFIPPSPSPTVDLLILNYSYADYMHILHFSLSGCMESLIYSCCSWTSICLKGVNETVWLKEWHLVATGFNWRLKFWLQFRRPGFSPWVGKIPWRRAWQPTPAFLPGESHGQRSLVGYSPGIAQSRTRLTNHDLILILLLLATLCGLWAPSSPTGDQTWALGSESAGSQALTHQEIHEIWFLKLNTHTHTQSLSLKWNNISRRKDYSMFRIK